MRNIIGKLCCAVCAVGNYAMAFMTADIIRSGSPLDHVSGAAMFLCNAIMLYLFITCGFDLSKLTAEEEKGEPVITAEGFCTDFYETYFTDEEEEK